MPKIKNNVKTETALALKEIVRLIYDTDPYIYPDMFAGYADFESAFLPLLVDSSSVFSIERMYIAYENDLPVGILLPFKKGEGTLPTFDSPDANYVVDEVFKKSFIYLDGTENTVYINNVCVNSNMKGKKIGSLLIQAFISDYGKNKLVLDCLSDNPPALNLYKKYGFEIKKHTLGFAGKNKNPIPVVWMEREADSL